MGRRLIPLLTHRGHAVRALVRPASEGRLPESATKVLGDALKPDSYTDSVRGADTFVHLIGVAHPSPSKSKQFREIDLVSVQTAVKAATDASVRHFVYLSVAQPAPMMKEYLSVRAEGERLLCASPTAATFVRPWYVLGPGHRWPFVLLPFYWICERLPATREGARRLGLVTLSQMLTALVWAVENPATEPRVLDVPMIKQLSQSEG